MIRSCVALLAMVPLLTACAGAGCYGPAGNAARTPESVAAGGAQAGERVRWGGVLVETRHLNESTELEVIGYPLDGCGRPLTDAAPTGRFIIVRPGFLETTDYSSGRRVTARGRITGVSKGRVGEAQYALPRMESYKVHLWPETVPGDYPRSWITIGVGGGSGGGVYGGVGGGVGVLF